MTRDPRTTPAFAYAPDPNRVAARAPAEPPEWLIRWIVLLIYFLREPRNAVRLMCSGGLRASWWHDRPDLPAASAQAEAASVRGEFGNSIRWMCIRHGIGPGHPDWPELSRAIVAFGSTLDGFWEGAPPRGIHWWENPGVIPGMRTTADTPALTSQAVLQIRAMAKALPPVPSAAQAELMRARLPASLSPASRPHASRLPASGLPASWLPASGWHAFARAGPGPSTGPPICAGLPILSYPTHGASPWPAPLY